MSFTGKKQVSSGSKPPVATTPPAIAGNAIRKDAQKLVKDNLIEDKIPLDTSLRSVVASSNVTKFSENIQENFATAVHLSCQIKKPTDSTEQQKFQNERQKVNVAVPRQRVPRPAPPLNVTPIVLATHLVPSLPVGLFELLAEAVEAATQLPVSILYESRSERPVAKDVTDIAILPAYSVWEDGDFFPVTFVFAHRLNDNESGDVYVDVIVAEDRAPHVKDIMDLRGHRCALPDRRQKRGATALLFGDLRLKGENPAFFGNTLDSGSQIATLQMVAGRQAEVGVVEAPVLACNKRRMPGVNSLLNLGSLGPLPPYAIYVKKSLSDELREKISSYLLNLKNDEDWIERFSQYGIIGFTTNSLDAYMTDDDGKEVVTSVRYY